MYLYAASAHLSSWLVNWKYESCLSELFSMCCMAAPSVSDQYITNFDNNRHNQHVPVFAILLFAISHTSEILSHSRIINYYVYCRCPTPLWGIKTKYIMHDTYMTSRYTVWVSNYYSLYRIWNHGARYTSPGYTISPICFSNAWWDNISTDKHSFVCVLESWKTCSSTLIKVNIVRFFLTIKHSRVRDWRLTC